MGVIANSKGTLSAEYWGGSTARPPNNTPIPLSSGIAPVAESSRPSAELESGVQRDDHSREGFA